MQYMIDNYYKNLHAVEQASQILYTKLTTINENTKFDLIQGQSAADSNVFDLENKVFIYNGEVYDTLSQKLDELDEYSEYPFLYLLGIGNGLVIKSLLNNKKLERLVVFEPEIEILFIGLHLWDLSDAIRTKRLILLSTEEFNFVKGVELLSGTAKLYAKVYTLLYSSDYYEQYYPAAIAQINSCIIDAFEFIVMNTGNSIQDALQGLGHHIHNLRHMIEGPIYQKTFVKPHTYKRTDTVIMASSGPSLEKQLPLLKEIQDHVTIICGESTLKILELNGITPDICVSMERIIEVVKSFENISDDYKKKVVFVRASLQHEAVFSALDGATDMLVMRPYPYNNVFDLDEYGYLCSGTSVANMAHELSYNMGFKTCIIIGQDLAYGADGKTHAKGHNFGEFQNKIEGDDEIIAYGGEGKVRTNFIWKLFLRGLLQTVAATKGEMATVNATEGGARIEGTLEIPFSNAIATYIKKSKPKKKLKIIYPTEKKVHQNIKKIKKILDVLLKEGEKIQQVVEEAFLKIAEPCKKLENLTADEQLMVFDDQEIMELLTIIEDIRDSMNTNEYFKTFYYEIAQSGIVHNELDLAAIKVQKVHNPEENKRKALTWIYNHMPYFFSLAGTIHHIREVIKENNTL